MKRGFQIIIIVLALIIFGVVLVYNGDFEPHAIERKKFIVSASDGTEFKVTYILSNLRHISYEVKTYDKEHNKILLLDKRGEAKDIEEEISIEYLYENDEYKYYYIYSYEQKEGILITSDSKKIKFFTENSYMESINISAILEPKFYNELKYKYISALALNRIIKAREYDYLMAYAQPLIDNGHDEILEIVKSVASGDEYFSAEYFTKDEIREKCKDLVLGTT